MTPFGNVNDAHRDCWSLLPWVANERIDPLDFKRIDPHLRSCPACQAELSAQSRLRQIIRTDESVVIAPQASLQKLLYRLDAEQTRAAQTASRSTRRARTRARAPRWLAITAGAQTIAIAILLGALWLQSHALLTAPRFATLTAPMSVPQGPVIRIVFHDEVTIQDITAILHELDARIIAGPNTAGVYTIQLTGDGRTGKEAEALAAKLRRDDRVRFSEPAVAEITK